MRLVNQINGPGPHREDRELAAAAAQGDRRAAHRLADRLFSRVRATVLYMAPGHRDADDMIQTALVEVLRAAEGYRGESGLERWADRVVARTVMRHIKKRRRRDQVVSLSEELDRRGVAERQEHATSRRQLKGRLAELLGKLSKKRRMVVVLHWVHGYSVPEIAEMVDAPVNTVRDRLRKGKRKLKKWVQADPVLRDWLELVSHDGS